MLFSYILQFVPDRAEAGVLLAEVFSRLVPQFQDAFDSSLSLFCWLQVECRKIVLAYLKEKSDAYGEGGNGHSEEGQWQARRACGGRRGPKRTCRYATGPQAGKRGRAGQVWKDLETGMRKQATGMRGQARGSGVRSRSAVIARPFTFRCWPMLRPSISGCSGRCFFMAGTKKVWRPRVVKTWLMSAGCCGNVCPSFEKSLGEYRTVYAKRGCRGLCARVGNA